jgi:hypothetical protein
MQEAAVGMMTVEAVVAMEEETVGVLAVESATV